MLIKDAKWKNGNDASRSVAKVVILLNSEKRANYSKKLLSFNICLVTCIRIIFTSFFSKLSTSAAVYLVGEF